MLNGFNRQKGMTQIAWIFAIMFIIMMFILAVRLVPPYLESFAVKESLESVVQQKNIHRMSLYKVQEAVAKRFYVNDVKSVDAKQLKVTKEGDTIYFGIEYEVRVRAFGNVDMVLKFNKQVSTE